MNIKETEWYQTRALPQDDPEIQMIVQQMYEQRRLVGRIPSFVGYANMEHLKSELQRRGWVARLREDQETIYLEQVEGDNHANI